MFFYEACLEITLSIFIGFEYIKEYDSKPHPENESESNTLTRNVHRVLIFVFSGMLILGYVAVIAIMIMTRYAATKSEKIQPWVGTVYESLNNII